MEINSFIEKLEEEFEDLPKGSLKPQTSFLDIEDWGSMHALIIIALIDTEYDVMLTGEDIKTLTTIEELFKLVKSRK